ncbi:AAA family ATPase [archaeon]|nr:AAA family ATPase [archaeon]
MCEILEPGEHYKIKDPVATWEKIGGYSDVKERLEEMVSLPLKHPDAFDRAGMSPGNGILMWGPPKTGFNAFAEAAANSAGASYISASSAELIKDTHYITHLFEEAVNLAPCIVYIGEVDILAPRREAESTLIPGPKEVGSTDATRLLFAEVDKISDRWDIKIIGGTNRPDVMDPALLRNGRLDRKVYIPVPDFDDRMEILEMSLNSTPLASDVSIEKLAELTKNYASADLISLSRTVTLEAIREKGDKFDKVEMKHFETGMKKIPSSLTPETIGKYMEIYKEECKHRYMY